MMTKAMISDSERVADELSRTAGRLHEIADDAEAGRNDVRIDPSGFHALAYYMESWSLSIDPTCRNVSGCQNVFECSECRCRAELVTEVCNEYGEPFHVPLMPSFCPNCGARVVRGDD